MPTEHGENVRIARLERRVGVLSIVAIIGPLVAVALAALGAGAEPPDKIEAQRFTMLGKDGKSRVVLGTDADGPSLTFVDEAGHTRIRLGFTDGAPALSLGDENDRIRAHLAVKDEDARLTFLDGERKSRCMVFQNAEGEGIVLCNAKGADIGRFAAVGKELYLVLLDSKGVDRAALALEDNGAHFQFRDSGNGVIWTAP